VIEDILMYYLAFLGVIAIIVVAISRIKDNENEV